MITKCKCQDRGKGICRHHSKIKMRVLLKRQHQTPGQTPPVFYSFMKHNRKLDNEIIGKMIKNLEADFSGRYNWIYFYDNTNPGSDQPIYKLKG